MEPRQWRQQALGVLSAHKTVLAALEEIVVTAVLPTAARSAIAAASDLDSYPRHEMVEWDGHGGVIVGVAAGVLEIGLLSYDGAEVPVLQRGAGDIVELEEGGWSPPDATTVTVLSGRAEVLLIPAAILWAAIRECPRAIDRMHEEQRQCMRGLGGIAGNSLATNPDIRIDHELWRATGGVPDASATFLQSYLARRARTTESRVSRRLTELRRDAVIRTDRGNHHVIALNRSALEESD